MDHLGALFQELEDCIIQTRRWFHRHPELSLKEEETSAKIKDELGQMGIPFEELKPGHGVAATISGKGGHGARPDLANDPMKAACGLVLKLAPIPSNFYDVLGHSVVSAGKIESGSMGNTFPSYAEIRGTSRYYKKGGIDKICEKMERIAAGVAAVYDVDIQLEHDANSVAPVCNEPSLIPKARELALQVEGLALSAQTDPICAGDNFCCLAERYPGFYGVLGAGSPDAYPQHRAKFDIKESELRKGAEFIDRYIADCLK